MKQQKGSEAEFVEINGVQQYLLHTKSNMAQAPVLLFLHGGPGMSEAAFAYAFQPGWQPLYTVVHWDQPGAGKTLTKNKNTYPDMQELLGHQWLSTTTQYIHVSGEHVEDSWMQANQRLEHRFERMQ